MVPRDAPAYNTKRSKKSKIFMQRPLPGRPTPAAGVPSCEFTTWHLISRVVRKGSRHKGFADGGSYFHSNQRSKGRLRRFWREAPLRIRARVPGRYH